MSEGSKAEADGEFKDSETLATAAAQRTEVLFALPSSPDFAVLKEGWMHKLGGYFTSSRFSRNDWKKRWFVVTKDALYYYKAQGDRDVQGVMPLRAGKVEDADVEVTLRGRRHRFTVTTADRVMTLALTSKEKKQEWMAVLSDICTPRDGMHSKAGGGSSAGGGVATLDARMSMSFVLSDPHALAAFTKFLEREVSSENIKFWNDVQTFKKLYKAEDKLACACEIYAKYVHPSAPLQVNLPDGVTDALARALDPTPLKVDLDVFDAAETDIVRLMETDSFSRFLKSSIFKKLRVKLFSLGYGGSSMREGYLMKKSGFKRSQRKRATRLRRTGDNWRRRWFVLNWNSIVYYKNSTSVDKPLGMLDLDGAQLVSPDGVADSDLRFAIKGREGSFLIAEALTAAVKEQWVESIQSIIAVLRDAEADSDGEGDDDDAPGFGGSSFGHYQSSASSEEKRRKAQALKDDERAIKTATTTCYAALAFSHSTSVLLAFARRAVLEVAVNPAPLLFSPRLTDSDALIALLQTTKERAVMEEEFDLAHELKVLQDMCDSRGEKFVLRRMKLSERSVGKAHIAREFADRLRPCEVCHKALYEVPKAVGVQPAGFNLWMHSSCLTCAKCSASLSADTVRFCLADGDASKTPLALCEEDYEILLWRTLNYKLMADDREGPRLAEDVLGAAAATDAGIAAALQRAAPRASADKASAAPAAADGSGGKTGLLAAAAADDVRRRLSGAAERVEAAPSRPMSGSLLAVTAIDDVKRRLSQVEELERKEAEERAAAGGVGAAADAVVAPAPVVVAPPAAAAPAVAPAVAHAVAPAAAPAPAAVPTVSVSAAAAPVKPAAPPVAAAPIELSSERAVPSDRASMPSGALALASILSAVGAATGGGAAAAAGGVPDGAAATLAALAALGGSGSGSSAGSAGAGRRTSASMSDPAVPASESDAVKVCGRCGKRIAGRGVQAMGQDWHADCLVCFKCGKSLAGTKFFTKGGELFCEHDYVDLFVPRCAGCEKPIIGRFQTALEKPWHAECFKCAVCDKLLGAGDAYYAVEGRPHCEEDFRALYAVNCAGCGEEITGRFFNALGGKWHRECFTCADCGGGFEAGKFVERDGKPICQKCVFGRASLL